MQAFQVATEHAYGRLPAPDADGSYTLKAAYVTCDPDCSSTSAQGGVRLAAPLNHALAR